MRSFDEIYRIAADRKGGDAELEALLSKPKPTEEIAVIPDDRWLSAFAKAIFQAGFNWTVIDNKWPGFETAFDGFDPVRVAHYHDEHMDRLLADKGIVRNGAKIASVIDNARLLTELAAEHGSASKAFADWPRTDYIGLLAMLQKRGSRLGGNTGQRALRSMGLDSFILSQDVSARLVAEGVVDKPPSSARDMKAVQAAFDTWVGQSGRSMTEISRVLAYSV
ncbi:3-methyladenine DNA glycosylase [Oceanicola sp. 22II-s10i]|uniref:DNA-3-methyladenine glycosylase I n=1 Tax=Oceanicola sp. 22II-s10i TaxID=1317116 RepID=UPI000B5293A9|nr:DNA-3-methyladenine glycosylase I [Oceanicola sp. 22II-s10i]OWU85713.1 3-methyladenine DNA glycosylase [Oceanicola sp. 22II-s10i]